MLIAIPKELYEKRTKVRKILHKFVVPLGMFIASMVFLFATLIAVSGVGRLYQGTGIEITYNDDEIHPIMLPPGKEGVAHMIKTFDTLKVEVIT